MKIPNLFNSEIFYRDTKVDPAGQFLVWLAAFAVIISLVYNDLANAGFFAFCILFIFGLARIFYIPQYHPEHFRGVGK